MQLRSDAHPSVRGGHILAAPGVRAVVVVVLEIALQIGAQGRETGDQGAREGGAVALLQDGMVYALAAAVALEAAGRDAGVAHAGLVQGVGESGAAELAGVVGADPLEPPTMARQVHPLESASWPT